MIPAPIQAEMQQMVRAFPHATAEALWIVGGCFVTFAMIVFIQRHL